MSDVASVVKGHKDSIAVCNTGFELSQYGFSVVDSPSKMESVPCRTWGKQRKISPTPILFRYLSIDSLPSSFASPIKIT